MTEREIKTTNFQPLKYFLHSNSHVHLLIYCLKMNKTILIVEFCTLRKVQPEQFLTLTQNFKKV